MSDAAENAPQAGALPALADQVQRLVIDSGLDALGFVVILRSGIAEYRSPLDTPDFRRVLAEVARVL